MSKKQHFLIGVKASVPVFLGYIAVSFAFGITTVNSGLPSWSAILISMSNLTSAGQVAGVAVICSLGTVAEMIACQLTINLRYCLMSLSLSQKLDSSFNLFSRLLCSFGITDEIYALANDEANKKGKICKYYLYGLMVLPIIGWSGGTALGAFCGDILPNNIVTALGVALFGMFIAIIIPPAKKHKNITIVILIAIFISCMLKFIPLFSFISQGMSIIISAVIAAFMGAIFLPVKSHD